MILCIFDIKKYILYILYMTLEQFIYSIAKATITTMESVKIAPTQFLEHLGVLTSSDDDVSKDDNVIPFNDLTPSNINKHVSKLSTSLARDISLSDAQFKTKVAASLDKNGDIIIHTGRRLCKTTFPLEIELTFTDKKEPEGVSKIRDALDKALDQPEPPKEK